MSRVATEARLKNYRDPFAPLDAQRGNGEARTEAAPHHAREGAGVGMQFDRLQDNGSRPGKVQGPVAQAAQQPDHERPRQSSAVTELPPPRRRP